MKLTAAAYNGLNKIASRSGMDCWFSLTERAGNDVVYDIENKKIISLKEGLKDFKDGITEPYEFYGLNSEEASAVENLLCGI